MERSVVPAKLFLMPVYFRTVGENPQSASRSIVHDCSMAPDGGEERNVRGLPDYLLP